MMCLRSRSRMRLCPSLLSLSPLSLLSSFPPPTLPFSLSPSPFLPPVPQTPPHAPSLCSHFLRILVGILIACHMSAYVCQDFFASCSYYLLRVFVSDALLVELDLCGVCLQYHKSLCPIQLVIPDAPHLPQRPSALPQARRRPTPGQTTSASTYPIDIDATVLRLGSDRDLANAVTIASADLLFSVAYAA